MASSSNKSTLALFLVLNLVLFCGTSATTCPATVRLNSLLACGTLGVVLGSNCCSCFPSPGSITSLEAAICLCTAIDAKICLLGVGVNATVYIKAKLGGCGFSVPSDYVCV